METNTMNFAATHRLAVRESLRQELNRELSRIYDATHVAATGTTIYCYGTKTECADFATGCRRVEVRAITDAERADLARRKHAAYRA